MLKFFLASDDGAAIWARDGVRWCRGRSWVEPFDHPALESTGTEMGASHLRVRVAERGDPEVADWAELDTGEDSTRVTVGPGGNAPIYVTATEDGVWGSWDLRDFAGHLDPINGLLDREVARFLLMSGRYSSDTVFSAVLQVTERSTAEYEGSRWSITYPDPVPVSRPRALTDDADPVSLYEQLLATAIARRPVDGEVSLVELSGGMDSANVALSLGAMLPGAVATCAMILPGERGTQQRRRREELAKRANLGADHTIEIAEHLPFSLSDSAEDGVRIPGDETWAAGMNAMLAASAAVGARWVFGGIGGDELTSLRPDEQPAGTAMPTTSAPLWAGSRLEGAAPAVDNGIAPPSALPETALMALSTGNTRYLEAGIWTISPLIDPLLVRFGQWLPREWRAHKRLHRQRLLRCSLSSDVAQPPIPEHFGEAMDQAIEHYITPYLARMLTDGALLFDSGFVNPDGLRSVLEHPSSDPKELRALHRVAALERSLRTWI